MSEGEFVKQEPQFAAFIGIDWADKRHVWCLQAMGSEKRESGELKHTPEAVEAWVGQGPKNTLEMPTCCWIYYCSIATSCADWCRIQKQLARCKVWST